MIYLFIVFYELLGLPTLTMEEGKLSAWTRWFNCVAPTFQKIQEKGWRRAPSQPQKLAEKA